MKPYYQDEWVTIYHGDCREILPQLPKVDLVLTDMVYDNLDFTWLNLCFDILTPTGSSYVITDYRSVAQLKLYLDTLGILRNWIVWCYRRFAPQSRQTPYYIKSHADILYYTKSDDYQFQLPRVPLSEATQIRWQHYMTDDGINEKHLTGKLKKSFTNVNLGMGAPCPDWWYFPIVSAGHKPLHQFEKPSGLIKRMIVASSIEGNLILDPFLGSGTTAYCAKKLNRKCIGIEIEEKYCEIAANRCRQSVMELGL